MSSSAWYRPAAQQQREGEGEEKQQKRDNSLAGAEEAEEAGQAQEAQDVEEVEVRQRLGYKRGKPEQEDKTKRDKAERGRARPT